MIRKKFNKLLYEQNDKKGKEFATKVLNKLYPALKIIEGSKFGVDLQILDTNNSIVKTAEVEIRNNWDTDYGFPFSTVNIPERKRKFFNGICTYFSINKNCTRCLMIEDKDILNSPLVKNPNKYISSDEMFFQIPKEKCKDYILDEKETTKIFCKEGI